MTEGGRPPFDWLPEAIRRVRGSVKGVQEGWDFVLNPPARPADIQQLERYLGAALSPSYRTFLQMWNGAALFRVSPNLVIDVLDVEHWRLMTLEHLGDRGLKSGVIKIKAECQVQA